MTVNPTTQRTSSAERSRRYRKRQQLRHIVLPVTIDEFALADALVAAGRLT